jgi:hypothetical protein
MWPRREAEDGKYTWAQSSSDDVPHLNLEVYPNPGFSQLW